MSHTVPDFSPRRRRLLAGSIAAAGAALNPRALLAVAPVPTPVGATLAVLTRTLFPLVVFGDAHHAAAAAAIEERCAAETTLVRQLERALAALPAGWQDDTQAAREATLRERLDPAFLKLARQIAGGVLFGAPDAWPHFGYPGPSLPFGGYLERKLVDLPWLKEASA